MNIGQIEGKLRELAESHSGDTFIYDLLLAYGLPKASIARLQKGSLNLSKLPGEIIWKRKMYFRTVQDEDLHGAIDELRNDPKILKYSPRFIIVTDNTTLLAVDTRTADTLDVEIAKLARHYDFFLPWAGMEKAQAQSENPADVKAAERMAKLFDEIRKDNPDKSPEFIHGLNVFLSRLLFCFFAEDTNIFAKGQFTNAVKSHTQDDGSDLAAYLERFFEVLNTIEPQRKNLPAYLEAFPYVNGGLFRDRYPVPKFTRRSRQAIIESGDLDWSAINPDIFGSMFQAVVAPDLRGSLGMHYTSVPNIMKVIEPLFLNELYEEFKKALEYKEKEQEKGTSYRNVNSNRALEKLHARISNIKIFDPACGSGNFLIIAYKELRKLEMKIIEESHTAAFSNISLDKFYGIEIDDFAHEIAILSLWLTEHQMNVEFFKKFGQCNPTLPLKEAGNIVCGNATRLNWEDVCPKKPGDEIYILGNPPYLGSSMQNKSQKDDLTLVCKNFKNYKNLDYISCWFIKSAYFIRDFKSKYAFVSTNSISQGEQVSLLWPYIFSRNLEIDFAYQSFKWSNNAKGKAGVTVVIIGVRNISNDGKRLIKESVCTIVKNINAYLIDGANTFLSRRGTPISTIPEMIRGSTPTDNGNLILSFEEKEQLLLNAPESERFIKRLIGSEELINGKERFCLWIEHADKDTALKIQPIAERIERVRKFRMASKAPSTVEKASFPYRFIQAQHRAEPSIIIPRVVSERREYITSDFFGENIVVLDSAQAIYNCKPYLFGIISSRIHMVWVRATSGCLESRIRYSSALSYHNFPFPNISQNQKNAIEELVFSVLEERERHPEKTLAQLYDPDKMPDGLREAHHQLDLAVERCYRSKPFESDEERLEYLFKLYEKMIAEENK